MLIADGISHQTINCLAEPRCDLVTEQVVRARETSSKVSVPCLFFCLFSKCVVRFSRWSGPMVLALLCFVVSCCGVLHC